MGTVVFTAGGFDPLHIGHLHLLLEARELGDLLIVSVTRDRHLMDKKGYCFMNEYERGAIVAQIKPVDFVEYHLGDDGTVKANLKRLKQKFPYDEIIFAKGGDWGKDEIPEKEICDELGITVIDGVGGGKVRSSSEIVEKRWSG